MKKRIAYFLVLIAAAHAGKAQLLDSMALERIMPITSMDSALKDPDKVVKLELKKKKYKEFPKEILRFKNLQWLDLTRNQIVNLPEELGTLVNLQYLNLSHNDIETLPKSIGNFKSLKKLVVNNNSLNALPAQIGSLENLRVLDLWSNNINYFPDEMSGMKNLKVMDLRVILINSEQQKRIQSLLPNTKIYFSPDCHCGG